MDAAGRYADEQPVLLWICRALAGREFRLADLEQHPVGDTRRRPENPRPNGPSSVWAAPGDSGFCTPLRSAVHAGNVATRGSGLHAVRTLVPFRQAVLVGSACDRSSWWEASRRATRSFGVRVLSIGFGVHDCRETERSGRHVLQLCRSARSGCGGASSGSRHGAMLWPRIRGGPSSDRLASVAEWGDGSPSWVREFGCPSSSSGATCAAGEWPR